MRKTTRSGFGRGRSFHRACVLSITIVALFASRQQAAMATPSPPWARDLVIYEIAPKAFTSPKGPESGTFEGVRSKLSYLQELGITGIWLTGHSLSHPSHFLNIWSQYACIEPEQLDPSLGTPEQFKALIDEAHNRGIRIFLDVIEHGLIKTSSIIREHPNWFRGEKWGGMMEYDWVGGHTDLDDWWVNMWTSYVTRYGVDGFRIDLGTVRPDLWARIRATAAAGGHPIVVFEEGSTATPGLTDFGQGDNQVISKSVVLFSNTLLRQDLPRWYRVKFGKEADFTIEIEYQDGTKHRVATGVPNTDLLSVRLNGLTRDTSSSRRIAGHGPDGIPDLEFAVDGVEIPKLRRVRVFAGKADPGSEPPLDQQRWAGEVLTSPLDGMPVAYGTLAVTAKDSTLLVSVPTLSRGNSLQLSSHDNGQVGLPQDQNPYSAEGSRAMFGYAFLFTPMIPLFMAGEEFDATFNPLPNLSPNFFGGKNPGEGKWLYGAMLDWSELKKPANRAMLEDVKQMIAIRRRESSLLTPDLDGSKEPNIAAVPHESDVEVPVPYVRWNSSAAIIVLANRSTARDALVTLNVPTSAFQWEASRYQVTDLWSGGPMKRYTARDLASLTVLVRRDKSARGGVGLLRIEPISNAPVLGGSQ